MTWLSLVGSLEYKHAAISGHTLIGDVTQVSETSAPALTLTAFDSLKKEEAVQKIQLVERSSLIAPTSARHEHTIVDLPRIYKRRRLDKTYHGGAVVNNKLQGTIFSTLNTLNFDIFFPCLLPFWVDHICLLSVPLGQHCVIYCISSH